MTILKQLAQLNEAVTPSKFYAVAIDDNISEDAHNLIHKIFSIFGYSEIGHADEFLDDEQQQSLNDSNLPFLSDVVVFAKNGLTTNSFKSNSDLVDQLFKDLDSHDYIGV